MSTGANSWADLLKQNPNNPIYRAMVNQQRRNRTQLDEQLKSLKFKSFDSINLLEDIATEEDLAIFHERLINHPSLPQAKKVELRRKAIAALINKSQINEQKD